MGEKYGLYAEALLKLGIKTYSLPCCAELCGEERHHADMLVHHVGKNRIFVCKNVYSKVVSLYKYSCFEFLESAEALQQKYPRNILLNGLNIGNLFFHNLKNTDKTLISEYENKGYKLVNVKQGYSKCSVAVIDESSAITSDCGMAEAMTAAGIEVLLIRPGYIVLEENHYGFIGGSTVKLSGKRLAFTGSLELHPDKNRILRFLENKKTEPVFLTDGPLTDVGSILPVMEEDNCS
ncbi:MAG: hypothetical protein Q8878_02035 [Bacillota bacterium]|nr:hypothetical protein [Bacillota bacterium]